MNVASFTSSLCLALTLLIWPGSSLMPVQAAEVISVPGLTEPILDSTLGTPVAGIVAERRFKEGDQVKRGQVLIELDRQLEELEVARRHVVLEPLKADFDANDELFKQPKSSVSKEIRDKKESDYKVALAEYALAKEQVRKRSIVAPFDGYIIEIFLQVGEACQIEQPVLRLADTQHCYFVCHVEAKAGHGLRVGQKVNLEIEAGATSVPVEGTLQYVSPVVDPASGLMKVKAVFDNPQGKLRPGVAGKMMFEEASHVSARR